MKRAILIFVGLITFFAACKNEPVVTPPVDKTLYELLEDNPNLSEFKEYVDVDATLKGYAEGTTAYTLFAPNNAAFDKIRAGLGVDSLDPIYTDIISSMISFHFVSGVYTKAELIGSSITTVQGQDVTVNAEGTIQQGVFNHNKVEIIEADIQATNGIMHIVETVLFPSGEPPMLGKLSEPILLAPDFSTLATGMAKADEYAATNSLTTISSILHGTDIHTIIAPTNSTFEARSITVETFTGQQWYGIIMNHIVDGWAVKSDFTTCATFSTLYTLDGINFGELEVFHNTEAWPAENGLGIYFDSNGDVDCDLSDSGASLVNLDAELLLADVFFASNGVLHVIDGVLTPK